MLRTMTKEEVLKNNLQKTKEIDQWWAQLHLQDKETIHEAFAKIIKQKYCTHPNLSTRKFYEDMYRRCPDCDLSLYEDQIPSKEVMKWQSEQMFPSVSKSFEADAEDFEGGGD